MTGATAAARSSEAWQTLLLRVLVVLFAAYLLWKVRLGVDFSDGSYMVALAVRVARGDVPLVDEMSAHVLGSLPAVPFTWVWLQLSGTDGVVLASRVFYVALAGAAGFVAYRALRVRFPVLPAGIAVLAALLPTPYALLLTTYNTVPGLGLLLGVTAGFAALATTGRSSLVWSVVAGAAAAVSAVGHPAVAGASVVLCVLLLLAALARRRREAVLGLLLGGGVVTVVVVSWLLLVPGLEGLRTAMEFNAAEQSQYASAAQRIRNTVASYQRALVSWSYLPLLLAVVAAVAAALALPRGQESARSARSRSRVGAWYGASLLAVMVCAVVPAVRVLTGPDPVQPAATPASLALVLCAALLLPVAVGAGRVDRDLRLLLVLSVPVAVAGVVGTAYSTKAGPAWGPQLPGALQLYAVLLLAVLLTLHRAWPGPASAAAAVTVLAALVATHSLHSFRDDLPWTMAGPIVGGPQAGLHTDRGTIAADAHQQEVVPRWAEADDTLLVHGRPSAYLYTGAQALSNALWQSRYGAGTTAMVDWLREQEELPDVVLLDQGNLEVAGGWGSEELADDALVSMLVRQYPEPTDDEMFLVFDRSAPGG